MSRISKKELFQFYKVYTDEHLNKAVKDVTSDVDTENTYLV